MTRNTLRALAIFSLGAALSSVPLLAQEPMRITIPFDFTVGSKNFTAGPYTVRPEAPLVLKIQSADGRTAILAPAVPGDHNLKPNGLVRFTFNRYENRYFLSRIATDQHGWGLPKSSVERELIAKRSGAKEFTVVASERK